LAAAQSTIDEYGYDKLGLHFIKIYTVISVVLFEFMSSQKNIQFEIPRL
jgi:hypothetical protein